MTKGYEIDEEAEAVVLAFKPVAERAMGGAISDTEYVTMVLSLGLERMVEDIINPPEISVLWDTIVAMMQRDPETFASFMIESMEAAERAAMGGEHDIGDRWHRYIG